MAHRLIILTACALLAACANTGPGPVSEADGQSIVPQRFARMNNLMQQARAHLADGRPEQIRALRGPLSAEGLALIRSRVPHDLRRQDVPRYLDARRLFGNALTRWVEALEQGGDTVTVQRRTMELDDAMWGWIDAYLGRATESAV